MGSITYPVSIYRLGYMYISIFGIAFNAIRKFRGLVNHRSRGKIRESDPVSRSTGQINKLIPQLAALLGSGNLLGTTFGISASELPDFNAIVRNYKSDVTSDRL